MSDIDKNHIWHPYSAMFSDIPVYKIERAEGVRLYLDDGRELIDGMASWWCVLHGYNHPRMNQAIKDQIDRMSHVMFGGLTHEPAIKLTEILIEITPQPIQHVFYSDSGSVAVEVALKMAIQYWYSKKQPKKKKFISLRCGYHGDTFAAMAVSDPDTGMHSVFEGFVPEQIHATQPQSRFGDACSELEIKSLEKALRTNSREVAAVILEPVVQGAGGMWFYSAEYLQKARALCDQYDVLLIFDEIATGFGRTGKLFACEHADVVPDIMILGKTLTGGYLTLAATLTTTEVAKTIDDGLPGVFMHGPTYMANALACTAAFTSIELLLESDWQCNVERIQKGLSHGLSPCIEFESVKEVRVLGAIGVVEMHQPVDMKSITRAFVDAGIWVRPFGRLIYLMPPYVMNDDDLNQLCESVVNVASGLE